MGITAWVLPTREKLLRPKCSDISKRPKGPGKGLDAGNCFNLLHIVRYGANDFQQLADLVAEAKTKDIFAPVTVVVPSPYAGLSLRRQLDASTGLVNVRFMVSFRLAEYLGSPRLVAKGKYPLPPLVEMAEIREAGSGMVGKEPLGSG